ncbi:HlyD family secretion protein [Helicovermis profundi]|uniref:Efflux RND transporter periplasmic adaptor subunit n=1 Tax=Helicovermis profundi TaxID=3065157 RepID=A0AAU9E3F2_9FIRM|nr:efflux RND transporter periplasmic adaptor subunit [Clostridia bacterium S502]
MKKIVILLVFMLIFLTGCAKENRNLSFTGSVEADEIDISSEISGVIDNVFVKDGDLVKKGSSLIRLNTEDIKIKLEKAKLAKEIAELTYNDIKNGNSDNLIDSAKYNVESINSEINGANKEIKFLEDNYNKILDLYNSGAETKVNLDSAKRMLDNENSKKNVLIKKYNALKKSYQEVKSGSNEETINKAKLNVDLKDLEIKDLEQIVKKSNLTSPINGTIQNVNYGVGELISPVKKAITVVDLKSIFLKIYVPEKELNTISLGENVSFTDEFLKGKQISGKIVYISSKAEFTPKNIESKENKQEMVYEVKIKITDNNNIIKPGMFLDVDLNDNKEGQNND